jgi:hypothetical protein
MATYITGLLKTDGHSLFLALEDGQMMGIDGTYQDAYAYFGSLKKDLEIDIQLI